MLLMNWFLGQMTLKESVLVLFPALFPTSSCQEHNLNLRKTKALTSWDDDLQLGIIITN